MPAAHHAAGPAVQGGLHAGLCVPLLADVHHVGQVGHLGLLVQQVPYFLPNPNN